MAELKQLAPARGTRAASVIFVHGLTGDPLETWTTPLPKRVVWPTWLAEDFEGLAVYSVGYDAPISDADAEAMHPTDIAKNLLHRLLIEPPLKEGQLILVGHSLGGLIIKMMLRRAQSERNLRAESKSFVDRVRKVAFLATPHAGADLAEWGDLLRVLVRPSAAAISLIRNEPNLRELNDSYRDLAADLKIDHLILTEREPLIVRYKKFGMSLRKNLGMIVKPDSADPGGLGSAIPIQANHIEIAKPTNRESEVYLFVKDFVSRAPGSHDHKEEIKTHEGAITGEVFTTPLKQSIIVPADISRIISAVPQNLIGRTDKTKVLDDAWAQAQSGEPKRPHVLTFVALGGEGKTSLVAHWAAELAHREWPGCEAAFAWSFYSQGTREQMAASSDLFVKAALDFFGDPAMAESAQGAYDKGKRLAQLVGEKRALLILDGLEPLQYASPSPMPGELKDEGLKALLKGLAQSNRGLCVVTTRFSIPDLRAFWQGTAPEVALRRLSKDAGVALLRALGVKGTQGEYETLVEDVKGHALTLNLLGSYLRDAYGGDIRKRDLVKLEEADEEEQSGHAFRAMDAYAHWFESGGERGVRALGMVRLLGLFDRPADAGCLAALWQAPAIEGLTEPLVRMTEAQRNIVLQRLEHANLLTVSRDKSGALVSLDAHPLLREYFSKELRKNNPAWERAHKRLFEYLCKATKDKKNPKLADLQPLYQAVAHGCQAGLQKEAFDKVYSDRILRGTGNSGYYSTRKLGAHGADLSAATCFFDKPWSRVSNRLTPADQAWLLNHAAMCLRGLGRVAEALEPLRTGLNMRVEEEVWISASIIASNLTDIELILGDVAGALADAERCTTYADRSGSRFEPIDNRSIHANVLHQAGLRNEAAARFAEAEAMQVECQPHCPLLYSLAGVRYCDLLLATAERAAWRLTLLSPGPASSRLRAAGEAGSNPGPHSDSESLPFARDDGTETLDTRIDSCRAVCERAARALSWAVGFNLSPLTMSLDHLTLGRAALYAAVLTCAPPSDACRQALQDAMDGLRRANEHEFISCGLLTRAWLRRLDGESAGAQEDLDEAFEIAERGPMPLVLADVHLHRARLFSAGAPPLPAYPWGFAKADLAEARRLIFKHGYLRRKEELEDAEGALLAISS